MASYLVFDTETTGLPQAGEPIEKQPYVLQLGAIVVDDDMISVLGEMTRYFNWSVTIPVEATKIHGIDSQKLSKFGLDPLSVMREFDELVRKSTMVAAYNLDFDDHIIKNAYKRVGGTGAAYDKRQKACLLQSAREFCALPYEIEMGYELKGAKRFKSPSLKEAHGILCKDSSYRQEDVHDAGQDTYMALEILQQLVWRNIPLIYQPTTPQTETRLEDITLLNFVIENTNAGADIRLTSWERGFVRDFSDKFNMYKEKTRISRNQLFYLRKIHAKIKDK